MHVPFSRSGYAQPSTPPLRESLKQQLQSLRPISTGIIHTSELLSPFTAVPLTFTVTPIARKVPVDQWAGPLVIRPTSVVFQTG
jgi:hypothetical protein